MEYTINLPDEFETFFEFIEANLHKDRKEFLEDALKQEIESINLDLDIF